MDTQWTAGCRKSQRFSFSTSAMVGTVLGGNTTVLSSCLIPRARATVTHACGLVRATGFDHWEPYERDARHSGLDSEQHHVRHWLWQARERPPSWSRHQASKPRQ